jgi:hydroxyacylglutathione hydrolase
VKIQSDLYLVGSGANGFDLTNAYDCNIFLLDAGSTCVLFDAGAGMGTDEILEVCRQDGVDLDRIGYLFLTHAHADHAGGAADLRDRLGVRIVAPPRTAEILEAGDEDAVSLTPAKAGGIYPQDYVYRSAPVETKLADGEVLEVGKFKVQALATPGHSHDHHSYLVSGPDMRYLIGGDAIFFGGKVILQNTYDCHVQQTIQSIERLATVDFDALLPGHLAFSLKNGKRHIDTAMDVIARFACPESIL